MSLYHSYLMQATLKFHKFDSPWNHILPDCHCACTCHISQKFQDKMSNNTIFKPMVHGPLFRCYWKSCPLKIAMWESKFAVPSYIARYSAYHIVPVRHQYKIGACTALCRHSTITDFPQTAYHMSVRGHTIPISYRDGAWYWYHKPWESLSNLIETADSDHGSHVCYFFNLGMPYDTKILHILHDNTMYLMAFFYKEMKKEAPAN